MSSTTIGLTLGKFAPLHSGHQLVIETALAEMDEVLILIYNCPEITDVPLNVRSRWIRDIYTNVEVIEAWDGPLEVGDTPAIKRMHEDYILKTLARRRITHFYSSEFYGDHVSQALGAVNRLVDPDRATLPVSGTLLRQNPYSYRQFIHSRVYRDLVANVVFLGAPSTGKTTMAEKLAQEFDTVWMPEYGREYWETHHVDRRLTLEQLTEIAEGHLKREEALLKEANRYLFTDTNAQTTYIFSLYYHGKADERLIEYANAASSRYDLVFLCDVDIPYDDTWDRSGEANRQVFQQQIIGDLAERKVPYFLLRGSLDARIDCVKRVLSRFRKYGNLMDTVSALSPTTGSSL
jgi:HTH-type transcriptional regulator, transcriptional repressor of NAD biosynthesis genes